MTYQLIHVNTDNAMFVTFFDESEKQKAWDCYDFIKMQKYVVSAMLIAVDALDCRGTILKSHKA